MTVQNQSLFAKVKESPKTLVENVVKGMMFGKAERLAAGICMGIPFFLLLGDRLDRPLWSFPVLAGIFILLPYGIAALTKRFINRKYYGLWLILLFGAVLYAFYFFFIQRWNYESRNSISQYVIMDDSYIFGLLLTSAAMLFMANGLFYWDDEVANRDGSKSRPINNFYLGLFLLGVVIFPCVDKICRWPHYVTAVAFYVGCAWATVRRSKGDKSKTRHSWIDGVTAFLMLCVFFVPLARFLNLLSDDVWPLLNIFGAESIGLWVIGVDFIIVSLDRLNAKEKKEKGDREKQKESSAKEKSELVTTN